MQAGSEGCLESWCQKGRLLGVIRNQLVPGGQSFLKLSLTIQRAGDLQWLVRDPEIEAVSTKTGMDLEENRVPALLELSSGDVLIGLGWAISNELIDQCSIEPDPVAIVCSHQESSLLIFERVNPRDRKTTA